MFIDKQPKESGQQAVVARSRSGNVNTEQLKEAFGDNVIVIDTDAEVKNGFEYLGAKG